MDSSKTISSETEPQKLKEKQVDWRTLSRKRKSIVPDEVKLERGIRRKRESGVKYIRTQGSYEY